MVAVFRAFCVCTVLITVAPTAVAESQAEVAIHRVTKAASLALRREASSGDVDERESALRELIEIHDRALAHSRFPWSASLQRTVLQIRARLRRALPEIQKPGTDHVSRLAAPRHTVLSQQFGNVPQAQANRVNGGGQPGGGQPGGGQPGGGQPGGGDFGPDLVDLIERTISPPIWDSNGGPATIVYFQPRQALVVRATQEAHRDVRHLLIGLRAAGGP